jgi:transcriptional regulator with XRE-family HTH domain
MSKKQPKATPISDAVRQAIHRSGLSRYEISKMSGVQQASLSRFMTGERGLTTATLDELAPILGLRLIFEPTTKKEKNR